MTLSKADLDVAWVEYCRLWAGRKVFELMFPGGRDKEFDRCLARMRSGDCLGFAVSLRP